MTRYEQGFMRKCAEYGVDGSKLLTDSNTYNSEALRSLSGLVGNDDVARVFIEDSDDRKKRDFNRYVLHATNPDIDYNSDRFSAQFDQFLNANLREMRKRKLKRILLEAMRSKNGITGAVYPNKDINSKLVSLLNGDDMRYLSSEKPWNGRNGAFIRGSGTPIASVGIPAVKKVEEDAVVRRYSDIIRKKTGKKVKFVSRDDSSDTYTFKDKEGNEYHIDLEDPNNTVY